MDPKAKEIFFVSMSILEPSSNRPASSFDSGTGPVLTPSAGCWQIARGMSLRAVRQHGSETLSNSFHRHDNDDPITPTLTTLSFVF
jgi:hypothetical protein